jgi:hypothetical protein
MNCGDIAYTPKGMSLFDPAYLTRSTNMNAHLRSAGYHEPVEVSLYIGEGCIVRRNGRVYAVIVDTMLTRL